MLNIDHKELIANLGKELGLELTLDEENSCQLLIEDSRIVNIRSNQEDGLIILSTVIAEQMPDPASYPMILDLLSFALGPYVNGGANAPVVGLDPESSMMMLYQVISASALQNRVLIEIVTDFLAKTEGFADLIANNESHADEVTLNQQPGENNFFEV